MAKIVYIDEAGTDVGAPVTVVAGVVIDQDKEWNRAWERLEDLRQMLPAEVRESFVFHATELYSGGRTLDRRKYDKDVRFPPLEALFASARILQIPMFVAYQWRHPAEDNWDPKNEMFFRHATTFLEALKTANIVMRELNPNERATLTAEDCPQMRQWLAQLPDMLRAANAPEFLVGPHPFDRIVDTPNFATKAGAPLLVFADAVAFAVRHYLSGHKDGPWAISHVLGHDEAEKLFADGRDQAGASFALTWRSC